MTASPGAATPRLELRGITKRYGSNTALDAVDFVLRPGEIHAVLGENGAGKSTLMHVVRGLTRPDSGTIVVDGHAVLIRNPDDARNHGVGMVHQHFMLVPSFTVAENLALSEPKRGSGWRIDSVRRNVSDRAGAIAERLGWNLPLDARVADLPVGSQQRVEIVRALLGDAHILLFDEPTAVLAPTETVELFDVLRGLRDEGRSIVFVSHKLGEVMDLCDRVTVLRLGRVVGVVDVADTNPVDLAARMVGAELATEVLPSAPAPLPGPPRTGVTRSAKTLVPRSGEDSQARSGSSAQRRTAVFAAGVQSSGGGLVLAVSGLSTDFAPNTVALKDITFDLEPGSILGIAGVDGNGQAELADVLTGIRPWRTGTIILNGKTLARLRARDLAELGVASIPPDRHRDGLALDLTVEDNLLLQAIDMPEFRRGPFVRRKALAEYAGRMASDFDVRASSLSMPVRALSGGNQQKIVVARALAGKPALIMAMSPTRGLDVAATAYIHDRLRDRRDQGGAIILISTELDEVIALSDRVAVMSQGRIVDIVPPDTPRSEIGLMMGGVKAAAND